MTSSDVAAQCRATRTSPASAVPIARPFAACYKSSPAMTDRPAHLTLHTGPRGAGYAYSYGTWRFS